MFFIFFIYLVEIVADRQPVIEHRDIVVQSLFVEILFVQGPPQFVPGQFVVIRARTHSNDRSISVFRVEILFPDEVILTASKINFIQIFRVRVFGDQPVHYRHRFVGLTNLIVCPRHLVEHLIVTLIVRIGFENLPVRLDRFARSRGWRFVPAKR